MAKKITGRQRRKLSIRKKVIGSGDRPRMTVFRSARHIYAQVIDDVTGKTVADASTLSKDLAGQQDGNKTDVAKKVGALIAERCKSCGVEQVVFDRNGYLFHGRVKALAEAAREAGLKF